MFVHPVILKHVLVCDEVQFLGWSNQLAQHIYRPSSFHFSATSYVQHCLLVSVWWGPVSDQLIGQLVHQGCLTASCFLHVWWDWFFTCGDTWGSWHMRRICRYKMNL